MRHDPMPVLLLVLLLAADGVVAAEPSASLTVSGLSSGGAMAMQLHVAYSDEIRGAAVFAGVPYYCAQGNLAVATTACMLGPPTALSLLETQLLTLEGLGSVAPLRNIRGAPVYIFSGARDTVVHPTVGQSVGTLYRRLSANVTSVYTLPSEHAFPTSHYGNPCGYLGPDYINNCSYDGAGAAWKVLYKEGAGPTAPRGTVYTFEQRHFTGMDPSLISMGEVGYAYLPSSNCSNGCQVHIALHGCEQAEQHMPGFVHHAGYNPWAESHNVLVLYPQVVKSAVRNPKGCWDWWGYTAPDYPTRLAPQAVAVMAMARRARTPSTFPWNPV